MNAAQQLALAAAALSLLSTPAQAETQTWRLSATTYSVQEGFAAPSFAEIGKTFYVDYVIDTATPIDAGWSGAVKSITVNGIQSDVDGYILSFEGFAAINGAPVGLRADGIDFLSFNNFAGQQATNVLMALQGFASSAGTDAADFRIDFGSDSLWARPNSFAVSVVPEPMSVLLLSLGVPLTILSSRRRARQSV